MISPPPAWKPSNCSREVTRAYAETYSWRACAEQFINNLEPLPVPERRKFWKRLARLRHALRIRRRKPKPGDDAGNSRLQQSPRAKAD